MSFFRMQMSAGCEEYSIQGVDARNACGEGYEVQGVRGGRMTWVQGVRGARFPWCKRCRV